MDKWKAEVALKRRARVVKRIIFCLWVKYRFEEELLVVPVECVGVDVSEVSD